MRPSLLLLMPEYRVDEQMSGIGVRALDLASAMESHCEVTIISAQPSDLPDPPCRILPARTTDIAAWIAAVDAVVFFDLGAPEWLRCAVHARRFIVVENAVPLEHLEYNSDLPENARADTYRRYVRGFRAQVAVADHFLTRSEIERHLLIGALALEGRLAPKDIGISRRLEHLVTNVPIGLSRKDLILSHSTAPDPNLYLWTGGLWDYMAYETALDCFLGDLPGKHLRFLYRPAADQPLRAHKVLLERNLPPEHISFLNRPLPHSQRGLEIEQGAGLICLGRPGIENETSVRLRLRDTLLYRRPIIIDGNGASGEYVRKTGIGITLPELNASALRDAIVALEPSSRMYDACLAAIDQERKTCKLDLTLLPFLQAGQAAGWRPTRRIGDLLVALDRALEGGPSDIPAPFLA